MKTKLLFVMAVILAGCASPQRSGMALIPEEQPLEKYVREWKETNSRKTGLINAYLKKIGAKKENNDLIKKQEDIPINDAKKFGIPEEAGKNKLRKLTKSEYNKNELLLALYNREAERENLVLFLYKKTENGSYQVIFESKEEGNIFFNVTVFSLGKGNGDCICMEYGVCTCNSTCRIYNSKDGNSLQEIYSRDGQDLDIRLEDLDNDGVSELIETNSINSLFELMKGIKENFKDINSRELMMSSIATKIVVYKWDGKEFKNSGELYR